MPTHARVCPPESPYAAPNAPRSVRKLLRAYGYQPNGEIARAGAVTIVTGLTLGSFDGHEQNVFFVAGGRVVATDMSSSMRYHFTADICLASAAQVVTAYRVNTSSMGQAPGCPPMTKARVRWRIEGRRVARLDPLPRPPCG